MGNSQNSAAQSTKYQYIQPKKLENNQDQPLNSIEEQFQNIFGIKNKPPAKVKEVIAQSIYVNPNLLQSLHQILNYDKQNWRDRQYQDRISHLQQQILYLKSIIEQPISRSRRESPVHNESNDEQEVNSIQQSRSQMNVTYFQSREQQDNELPHDY